MYYQVTKKDLDVCLKFAIDYHLDETKSATNRTTGQYRGLGGIIDSFVIGKLIEIGVSKIIEKESNKVCNLDFNIHKLTKESISDPDIISISEGSKTRTPNLYVEIKNISESDRWIGLTTEQFNTILSNKLVNQNPKNVFLIYASLETKNKNKDIDPLGIYLKSNINLDLLKKFCDVGDLHVSIKYVLNGQDFTKFATHFNQGSFLYETDIFKEARPVTCKKVLSGSFEKLKHKQGQFPIIMTDAYPSPKEFGDFTYTGDITIYHKKNFKNNKESSRRIYVVANKDTQISNRVLGQFFLKQNKVYGCNFCTVGRNPSLKRNNIWIAHRNLKFILALSTEQLVCFISKTI